ncbi:MAG: hypothetical protein ACT4OS_07645 [Acidimicrobiales bacterium]
MTEPLGYERARRLHQRLVDAGRAVCRFEPLLAHWVAAAPELIGAGDQMVSLRQAIEALVEEGRLTVPKGRLSWDSSFTPALPRFVVVAQMSRRRLNPWREMVWRHELGWVASLQTMSDRQLIHLTAINDWLVSTRGGRVAAVPQRIRSAEIFGDEKVLDELARSALFVDGRLSWALLAAAPVEPPLALRRVGPGGAVLVVENSDPFWLCVEALIGQQGPIGLVAWGQGRAGMRSLPTLARDPGVSGPVWYWGDFDPAGLAIPVDTSDAVAATGLGPLVAAVPFYSAMADHAERSGGTECRTPWGSRDYSAWLGAPLWARFAAVIEGNLRVAQEVLGPELVVSAAHLLA